MVVDEEEWETGIGKTTIKAKILEFLEKNYPKGYELNEIMDAIGIKINLKEHPVLSILEIIGIQYTIDELKRERKIEEKYIEGKGTHYRFHRR